MFIYIHINIYMYILTLDLTAIVYCNVWAVSYRGVTAKL